MNKIIFLGLLVFIFNVSLEAQTVHFRSADFEKGVKYNLGLTENDEIMTAHIDTITKLDMSSLGLIDIRDVGMFCKLRSINLSYNKIEDASPLALLDSLRVVDLSFNKLENINMLAFSNADEMEVDITANYIHDLSIFKTLTQCQFSIDGAGLQKNIDAPIFNVRYLYADATSENPSIYYRVEASPNSNVQMLVQNAVVPITTDDQPHVYHLGNAVTGIKPVFITGENQADSTYLTAIQTIEVDSLSTVTVETGLPDEFDVLYSATQHGTLTNDGVNLTFTAGAGFNYEEVIYTFFCGGVFKGAGKIVFINNESGISTVLADVTNKLNVSLNGNTLIVKCDSSALSAWSTIEVYDVAGRLMASHGVDSTCGIDVEIPLDYIPKGVIIVQLTSGNNRFANKVFVK